MIPTIEDTSTTLEEEMGLLDTKKKYVDPASPNELRKVDEQATLLNVDPSEVSKARVNEDSSYDDLIKQYSSQEVYLEYLRDLNTPVDEAAQMLFDRNNKLQDSVLSSEYLMRSALMADDESVSPEAARLFSNYELALEIISKKVEEEDPSTFKFIAGGFLEFGREVTVGIIENLRKQDQKLSTELSNALLLPTEDFEIYLKDIIETYQDRGLFNLRKAKNIEEIRQRVEEFGTDKDASLKQFIALAEIATAGTTRGLGKLSILAGQATKRKLSEATLGTLEKVMSSKTGAELVTATRGAVDGAKVTVKQLNTKHAPDRVAGSAGPTTLDPFQGALPTNTPHAATIINETNKSNIFDALVKMMGFKGKQTVTGRAFDYGNLDELVDQVNKRIIKSSNNPVVKIISKPSAIADEGSDTFVYTATLGNAIDGMPFPTKEAALRVVKNNPAYKVVEAPRTIRKEVDEGVEKLPEVKEKDGYYLEYSERLDTRKLAEELEDINLQENFIVRMINNVLAAPQTILGARVGSLINASENVTIRAGQLANEAFKSVRKLDKRSFNELETVMLSYRDGFLGDMETGLSSLRAAPTDAEFTRDFFSIFGKIPTESQLKGYAALTDLNNAAWNIKATDILKRVAEKNGRTITVTEGTDGTVYNTIGYAVDSIADEVVVFSRLTGQVTKETLGDRIAYKLEEPFEAADGIFYDHVTDVLDSRVPIKTDVLGYNVGGTRNNEGLRHFIGKVFTNLVAGKGEVDGGFRTLLGSFSNKEARKAVNELNNIQKALDPFLKVAGLKGIRKLTLTGDDLIKVNAVIARNTTWNPHVSDFTSLKKIAERHGESFAPDSEFITRGRDESLDMLGSKAEGMTAGEYQSMRVSRKRGDTPPMTYGGAQTINQSPIQNIIDQFKSETYRYSHYKATQSAVNGWVQKANRLKNVEFAKGVDPKTLTPEEFIQTAKVSSKSSPENAELRSQQRAIKSRLGLMERTDRFTPLAHGLAELIYDKGILGFKKGMQTKPEDWIGQGAGQLRALSFHMKMGMGNPDQFVLNASHVAQIMAISNSGFKAAPNVPIIAGLLFKTRKAAEKDIEKIVETTLRENGTLGMTKQELIDTVRYIKETGRHVIGTNTLERSGAAFNDKASKLNELLELGLTPYKGGELFGRIAAIATAVIEHNVGKVSKDVFSDKGIQFVSNREQVLSYRMTSGQRGQYQENSIMALATQWQSYSLRFAENVLIGRDLTRIEKTRALAANILLFGARGVGLPPRMIAAMASLGIDPEDENAVAVLNAVKFGTFDMFLSKAVGTDVSLGVRIGPMNGVLQQYYDYISDESVVELIGGPSAQIISDSYSTLKSLRLITPLLFEDGSYLPTKWSPLLTQQMIELSRNVKSADMWFKARDLVMTGKYQSKKGSIAGEFSREDVTYPLLMSMAGGATPMNVLNFYDAKDISYGETPRYKDARNLINRNADRGLDLIRTGDPDKIEEGKALYTQARALIFVGGFSVNDQRKLNRSIANIRAILDIVEETKGQSKEARITAKAAQGD